MNFKPLINKLVRGTTKDMSEGKYTRPIVVCWYDITTFANATPFDESIETHFQVDAGWPYLLYKNSVKGHVVRLMRSMPDPTKKYKKTDYEDCCDFIEIPIETIWKVIV